MIDPEEGTQVDLREVMRQYDEMGMRPQGFVFMYSLVDNSEVADDGTLSNFFRMMSLRYEMEHHKRVFISKKNSEDVALIRFEMGWFGDWEGMAKLIETIEDDIRTTLETFIRAGSLEQMPHMEFMFANREAVEDIALESEIAAEDEDIF